MRVFKFRELAVYKEGREFINLIYEISEKFPKNEIYGITSQLRRAGVSINLNIAEGNGRSNRAEQKQFYNVAKASLYECIAVLDICIDRGYITEGEYTRLGEMGEKILARLNGLIKYTSSST